MINEIGTTFAQEISGADEMQEDTMRAFTAQASTAAIAIGLLTAMPVAASPVVVEAGEHPIRRRS